MRGLIPQYWLRKSCAGRGRSISCKQLSRALQRCRQITLRTMRRAQRLFILINAMLIVLHVQLLLDSGGKIAGTKVSQLHRLGAKLRHGSGRLLIAEVPLRFLVLHILPWGVCREIDGTTVELTFSVRCNHTFVISCQILAYTRMTTSYLHQPSIHRCIVIMLKTLVKQSILISIGNEAC